MTGVNSRPTTESECFISAMNVVKELEGGLVYEVAVRLNPNFEGDAERAGRGGGPQEERLYRIRAMAAKIHSDIELGAYLYHESQMKAMRGKREAEVPV